MGKIPRHRKSSKVFSRSKTSKVTPKTMITQKLKRTLRNTYARKMKVISSDTHNHKHKHKHKHKQTHKRKSSWKKTYKGKKRRVSFSKKAVEYPFSKGSRPGLIKHSMAIEKQTK
uniref:Uncharacterized protein n=1 Tax=Megaviridae environmental sample TaxID=1737588 RepID=A0A5J6VLY2_9VIRU|nr:MAG: hypothetical protein [Megaviridae environmental sample]